MTKFEEEFDNNVEMFDVIGNHNSMCCEVDQVKEVFKDWELQQALPVVPYCVAEMVERDKQAKVSISDVFEAVFSYEYHHLTEAGLWMKNNPEQYIIARNIGYTVEKPQQKRYEVKLLSGESMHFNPIGNPKNIKDYRFSFGNYAGWKTKFTKSELSEIKDGMFLKRIPGGTNLDDLGKDKSYYVWIDDCNYWKNPLIELVPVEDGE